MNRTARSGILGAALAGAALVFAAPLPAKPQRSEGRLDADARVQAAAAPAARTQGAAELGASAPDFTLRDTEGAEHRLADYVKAGKTVVLEWFNPDCPFVQKHHVKNKTMAETSARYAERDVVWLAVNSGAKGKQGHGLERNRKARADYGIAYPLLLDETGAVGRAYGAKTTPHMYVIRDGLLVYAGAIDSDRSAGKLGETNWVAAALDAALAGKAVENAQTKPYGCSVKYGPALP